MLAQSGHEMVEIHCRGTPVAVDVIIAPLMSALWARGVDTSSSCEDMDSSGWDFGVMPAGLAYIAFTDERAAWWFARTARLGANADAKVLVIRAENAGDSVDGFGFAPGAVMHAVLFPADRIAELTRRVAIHLTA